MPRAKKTKEVKGTEIVTTPKVAKSKKETYVVVLGTPSFYVIKMKDGTMKTIQGSNKYRRGDTVTL